MTMTTDTTTESLFSHADHQRHIEMDTGLQATVTINGAKDEIIVEESVTGEDDADSFLFEESALAEPDADAEDWFLRASQDLDGDGALDGDFNGDGVVDGLDYTIWNEGRSDDPDGIIGILVA